MNACYHNDVVFSDPVFLHLKAARACAMWNMLVTSAKDLEVVFKNVVADEKTGSCDWEAEYTFSKTGRRVHNRIHAKFEFRDGKIFRHTDRFSLPSWAGMALGLPGKLFGWTPWLQARIQASAEASLAKFEARKT